MTNKISLPLVVWTSFGCWEESEPVNGRGWRFLLREGEKTQAALRCARRVSPLQQPIQLPLMRAALSVSPLSCMHNLFKEAHQKENGGRREMSGCAGFPKRLPRLLMCWLIRYRSQEVSVVELNQGLAEWFWVPWLVGWKNGPLPSPGGTALICILYTVNIVPDTDSTLAATIGSRLDSASEDSEQ